MNPRAGKPTKKGTPTDSDIILDMGCPTQRAQGDLVVCACGESRKGTGRKYWDRGLAQCDYSMTTYAEPQYHHGPKDPDDTMRYTYSTMHFAPECANATNVAKLMDLVLRIPTNHSRFDKPEKAPLTFVHKDCKASSGREQIIKELISKNSHAVDRWGACLNNGRNSKTDGVEPTNKADWYWHDSEANRDTTKTMIAARYDFTAALENTKDEWYFTEKRWQALIAGSVPVVFRNDYSEHFTPAGADSVYFYEEGKDNRSASVQQLLDKLVAASSDDAELMKYHAWKHRGMRRDFVKELFRGFNYIPSCRLCELFTHGLLNHSALKT